MTGAQTTRKRKATDESTATPSVVTKKVRLQRRSGSCHAEKHSDELSSASATRAVLDRKGFVDSADEDRQSKAAGQKSQLAKKAEDVGSVQSLRALSESATDHLVQQDDDGDPTTDGQQEEQLGDFDLEDCPNRLRDQRTHAWRIDAAQEEVRSERHWKPNITFHGSRASSVQAIFNMSAERAVGKKRKAIDEWERHRQKLRAMSWPGLLPSMMDVPEAHMEWDELLGWTRPVVHGGI